MKSSYMISATGRIPCIAAPIAAPTIAISEIGVLRTRSGPNSSTRPWVTPIEPPISAMSSPMTKTSSSPRIASASASRTASLYDTSGTSDPLRVDVLESVLWLRVRPVLRERDRGLDDTLHLVLERPPLVLGHLEPLPQLHDRVVRLRLVLVLLRAVDLRIADVVAVHAVGLDVEEH